MRGSAGLLIALIAGLCAAFGVSGFLLGRHGARRSQVAAIGNGGTDIFQEVRSVRSGRPLAALPVAPSPRVSPVSAGAPIVSTIDQAHEMASAMRSLLEQRSIPKEPLEASVNRMDDYLFGMIAALRSANPGVFPALADEFADDTLTAGTGLGDIYAEATDNSAETDINYLITYNPSATLVGANGMDQLVCFATPAGAYFYGEGGYDRVITPKRGFVSQVFCGAGGGSYCGPTPGYIDSCDPSNLCNGL